MVWMDFTYQPVERYRAIIALLLSYGPHLFCRLQILPIWTSLKMSLGKELSPVLQEHGPIYMVCSWQVRIIRQLWSFTQTNYRSRCRHQFTDERWYYTQSLCSWKWTRRYEKATYHLFFKQPLRNEDFDKR